MNARVCVGVGVLLFAVSCGDGQMGFMDANSTGGVPPPSENVDLEGVVVPKKETPVTVQQAMLSGVPYVLQLNADSSAPLYLMKYDIGTTMLAVSALTPGRMLREFSNPAFADGELNMFGATMAMKMIGADTCLVLPSKPSECYGKFIGPRTPDGAREDPVAPAAEELVARIRKLMQGNFSGEEDLMCDSNGDGVNDKPLPRDEQIVRTLGDILYASADLNFLLISQTEFAVDGVLRDAAFEIIRAFTEPVSASSSQCGGNWKFRTAFHVIRGLFAYYRVTEDPQVRDSIMSLWSKLLRAGMLIPFASSSFSPLDFAQFMSIALVAQQLKPNGVFQQYAVSGIQKMLQQQALDNSKSCRAPKGNVSALYGGWGLNNGACVQQMADHTVILSSLFDLNRFLTAQGLCQNGDRNWSMACTQGPGLRFAGLSWMLQLVDAQFRGAFLSINPFVAADPTFGMGTAFAAPLFSRALGDLALDPLKATPTALDGKSEAAGRLYLRGLEALEFASVLQPSALPFIAPGLIKSHLVQRGARHTW